MKTLYILRHAKSSWDEVGLNDIDRPLTREGVNDSYHKAKILKSKMVSINVLITSPAFRALNTAVIIAKKIGLPLDKLIINEKIYNSGIKSILKVLKGLNKKVSCAMLVGHNPEITELSNYFSKTKIKKIPTCGLVCIEFRSFESMKYGKGTVKYVDFSKSKKLINC